MTTALAVKVFICYAREDEALRQGLERQLRVLRRQGLITVWQDRDISPGAAWEREIDIHLSEAQLILLLVSPDFIDSDYCYGIEMKQALKKHEQGEATVIPVILRPVYWQGTPFGKLQALPRDATPVIDRNWHTIDEAFFDVAEGIRKVVEAQAPLVIQTSSSKISHKTKEQWMDEASMHIQAEHYEEALAAYEQAIQLDSNYLYAYLGKGDTLHALKQEKEALIAYERAIQLAPNDVDIYKRKTTILHTLNRHHEALAVCEHIFNLILTMRMLMLLSKDMAFISFNVIKRPLLLLIEPFSLIPTLSMLMR